MQQLWYYRPQTCSGDKKKFLSTQIIRKYQLPIDQYGAQQSQVCLTKNEVGLHLNKVE